MKLQPHQLADARAWIADCEWANLGSEDVGELTDEQVIAGVARHYEGGIQQFALDNGACDACWDQVVPGAIWPMATDGDDSKPWVERCDTCEVFELDTEAARAVAGATNGLLVLAQVHGPVARGWTPSVYSGSSA